MAGAAILGRLNWILADVREVVIETPRTRSLVLHAPGWIGHRPGQHVDIRLTAEDGYQAERSYSIASAPHTLPADPEEIVVTIERLDDGEVSPYLTDEIRVGDRIELRGPIGGYFVWNVEDGGPLLLVAGGSGIVPLMAMLRHRRESGSTVPTRLLYSARSQDEIIYRNELDHLVAAADGLDVIHTLTRSQPDGWSGYRRRIDAEMLREVGWSAELQPRAFVCGPSRLVENVASSLVEMGYPAARVKTERFGPTG